MVYKNSINKLKMKTAALLLYTGLFAFAPPIYAGNSKKPESPNIILILADDMGWSQVSKPVHPGVPESFSSYLNTPNIDRLGDSGIRFTSGYSPAPLCTPTRRSILCGTTTARSGTEFKSNFVPSDHITIPKALKIANRNYLCAHFGKWGENMISSPEECGYDASDGHTGNITGGMPVSLGASTNNHLEGPPFFIDNKDPKLTFSVTESAIDFMQHAIAQDKPFYIQLSYYAVHLSIVCREETLEKYRKKGIPDRMYPQAWVAMLDDLDQGIGLLLDALDELGVSENTYVFFTSDNGSQENVMPGKNPNALPMNFPLTGSKQRLNEGGIRVPFYVRGPGIKAGSYCHIPVSGYDFLPTFYDLAGGKKPLSDEIDGGSICFLFHNTEDRIVKRQADALIFHRPRVLQSAVRQGDYKLFIKWNKNGEIQSRSLYNMSKSVVENENNDILEKSPEKADQLQKILLDHINSVQMRE
jgi:arylsulfatase A